MTKKLKLIRQLIELLPEDDNSTYPRLNFRLRKKKYASPIFIEENEVAKGNTAAKSKIGKYSFSIPKVISKTLTLLGTSNQTITFTYTEPGKLPVAVTSTSIDQEFKVQYGTVWTATVTGAEGYNSGTLSASSGTITGNITISVSEATVAVLVLTNSKYKMSQVYPDIYQTMTEVPDKLDISNLTTMNNMFRDCKALHSIDISTFDMSNVEDMEEIFSHCSSATTIILPNNFGINATNMSGVFNDCKSLTSLDLSKINTSKTTNMSSMFADSFPLTYLDLSKFDFSKVIYLNRFLSGAKNLKNIIWPSNLNTSNVTNMDSMFSGCSSLSTIPQLDTGKVTKMNGMFSGCESLTAIPQIDTSNVTTMRMMFMNCKALTSIPQLNTSKVTDMYWMFYNCTNITSIPQLNTSNVTDMGCMFVGCSSLPSEFPWVIDCSSITNANKMIYMFLNSSVTKVRLKNVKSSIKSEVTSQLLKCDDTLTINFV